MFKGENLANLRMMHGLSRKQLSESLGVTEQAIWQYENGYTSPKLQTMNALKSMFHVKTKYFYTDDMLTGKRKRDNINMMNIAYRSKILHAVSKTRAEAKHLEFLDEFVDELTASISYPTLKVIKLRDQIMKYVNHTNDPREIQIEVIAKIAREWLGLDNSTNDNLMFLIEKSGVFVFEKAIGEEIDAYSLWTKQERPYIILGNLKRSAVRRSFDLAHELGHLLLHYHVEFADLDRKDHAHIEKEANKFAGAFLLPEEAFSLDMKTVKRVTNHDAYIELKEKWNVSIQVLAYRAVNLGIIEPKTHRNFYAALHRRGYLKQEPLDHELFIQKPMKVKSLIDFVSNHKLIDMRHMIEKVWKVELPFFSKLTAIDSMFFENYIQFDKTIRKSQVTDLSSYR